MLALIRPTVMTARILTRSTRSLSTSDATTMNDVLAILGVAPTTAPPMPTTTHPPPTTSRTPPTTTVPPPEDPLLHYLTSSLLKHGHRAKAARITARTLLYIHAFTRAPPLPVLREAILAASPAVRTMMHRQGAKNIAKPIALGEKQRTRFAVQWILSASEKKTGQTVEERLARELIAVLQGTSEALRKKEETHRFAMVNRGNARSRI